MSKGVFDRNFRVVTKISSCRVFVVSSRGSRKQSWTKTRLKEKNAKVMLMLNFPFIYNFLEVELRGCDHDLRTMIEYFPLTVRYFIYSIPKAKCRPGHLNVNILNMAISHSLHLQSLHHNPHYHQHQHQGDLTLGWSLNFFCDVNKDLLRSFIVNKACRFPCHFFDMFNTKPTQRLKLGTFSIDRGDGSENVTFKMNWCFFQLCRIYFNSLKIAYVG